MSGSLSFGSGQVSLLHPAPFSFSATIGATGAVTSGTWNFGPIDEVLSGGAGQGMATGSSSGSISGTGVALTLSGTTHVSGTVTAGGTTIPLDVTTPFVGGSLQPTDASCGGVVGDLVFVGGVARYPFEANLVGISGNQQTTGAAAGSPDARGVKLLVSQPRSIGSPTSLAAEANQLVQIMDKLTSQPHPMVLEFLKLVQLLDDVQIRVNKKCSPAEKAAKLASYRKVKSSLLRLLSKLLPYSPGYTAQQLSEIFHVAYEYGLLPQLAPEIYAALTAKLSMAQTTNNAGDCATIAGMADLFVQAKTPQQPYNFQGVLTRAQQCASP